MDRFLLLEESSKFLCQARNKQAFHRECQRAPISPLSQARSVALLIRKIGQTPKRGVAEKKYNLKEAKAKQFCETPSHREMSKEYQKLYSDFSINK